MKNTAVNDYLYLGLTDEQRLAIDISKNTFVNAGAGTGKTTILVRRFLQILESVTFTSFAPIIIFCIISCFIGSSIGLWLNRVKRWEVFYH